MSFFDPLEEGVNMKDFRTLIREIETIIKSVYEDGVSISEAEKLAGQFLHFQLVLSEKLKVADLDARMRKQGVKAIRAALYTSICSKAEKKPTEAQLEATLTNDEVVHGEQIAYDKAETERDEVERVFNICREAHVYLRGVAKGRFE